MPNREVIRRNLHIMHASMRFSVGDARFEQELRRNLRADPDVLTMTETHRDVPVIRRVAADEKYKVFFANNSAEAILVKRRPEFKVKQRKYLPIHGGIAGQYMGRGVTQLKVQMWGAVCWFHVMHWVTLKDRSRHQKHIEETRGIAQLCKKHSKGDAVAFFMGDINYDDDSKDLPLNSRPASIFRQYGMVTVFNELGNKEPATIGAVRTIDIIGHMKADMQVTAKRFKVWPRLHSDHRAVSAWYELAEQRDNVTPPTKPPKDPTPTPGDTSGNPSDDDDFYATGGNVSWADYQLDDNYPLPAAVDDSDWLRS